MPEYLAPGVYVEEISGGAKPIEAVGTSTACFIGFTEKAQQSKIIDGEKQMLPILRQPIFLTSWEEYVETFGSFVPGFYTPLSVYAFFQNGGKRCYVLSLREIPRASRNIMSRARDDKGQAREFLKIEAKVAGKTGELLRTIIESVVDPTLLLTTASQSVVTSWKFKLKVQENGPAGAEATAESNLEAEELDFELYEQEKGGNKVTGVRFVGEPKSKLIDLAEITPDTPAAWSEYKELSPTSGATLALDSATSESNLPSVKPHLKAKAKKRGGSFKPLTITVVSSEAQVTAGASPVAENQPATPASQEEEPKFTLKVERLHPVTNKWEVKEKRQVTLRQEPKTRVDESGQTTSYKTLEVEYLNGQRPTLVDVVPLMLEPQEPEGKKSEIDVSQYNLFELWPETQTATLIAPRLKIADKTALDPAEYKDYVGDPMERTGMGGLEDIDDINFICMPDLMKAWDEKKDEDKDWGKKHVQAVQALAIAHCDQLRNRVVILDPPPNKNPQEIKKWRMDEARYDSSRAVLYYPWVEVMDPATSQTTFLPPSGFVAGVWARNDTNRGVHKAPANEVVQLAIGLQFEVGERHQEILNPNGINCIRPLRGMGIRVWGARTLSQSDPEWKYVNVRRLFHMIEQSIQRSTMWAVFESNDHRLWGKLRRDVRNFLMTIYSQGMLFGATPGQAFFVKCDEENNPKYTRDLGQVIIDIGVAPSKPAEFVIFRIRQWSPEDAEG